MKFATKFWGLSVTRGKLTDRVELMASDFFNYYKPKGFKKKKLQMDLPQDFLKVNSLSGAMKCRLVFRPVFVLKFSRTPVAYEYEFPSLKQIFALSVSPHMWPHQTPGLVVSKNS